jgi:hypothetical protein
MKVRVIRVFQIPDCDTRITRTKFGFCKLLPEIPEQNSGFGYSGFGFRVTGFLPSPTSNNQTIKSNFKCTAKTIEKTVLRVSLETLFIKRFLFYKKIVYFPLPKNRNSSKKIEFETSRGKTCFPPAPKSPSIFPNLFVITNQLAHLLHIRGISPYPLVRARRIRSSELARDSIEAP